MNFIVEQAGEPVPKQVIENGATSQLKQTMGKALKWRLLAIITS
jgi:hypothetical protein